MANDELSPRATISSAEAAAEYVAEAFGDDLINTLGLSTVELRMVAEALFDCAKVERSESYKLRKQVADYDHDNRAKAGEIASLRKAREEAETSYDALSRALEGTRHTLTEERKAHGETKAELFEALLTVERAKGYIDAIEDAKPAQMVEAPRSQHGVFSRQGTPSQSWNTKPASSKRWFER